MGTDPEEGLIYYNRVMVGHRRPFNHLSLFCLQHRQWGVSCTQQILELVEKCKRGSWTNTKRLLKPLRRRFMGGQIRWRTLVFGNLIQAVCWSDRKFQTGDFCLWSCSVTAESDTTMFFKRHEYVSWVHSQSAIWADHGFRADFSKPEILMSSITCSSSANEGKFQKTKWHHLKLFKTTHKPLKSIRV